MLWKIITKYWKQKNGTSIGMSQLLFGKFRLIKISIISIRRLIWLRFRVQKGMYYENIQILKNFCLGVIWWAKYLGMFLKSASSQMIFWGKIFMLKFMIRGGLWKCKIFWILKISMILNCRNWFLMWKVLRRFMSGVNYFSRDKWFCILIWKNSRWIWYIQ